MISQVPALEQPGLGDFFPPAFAFEGFTTGWSSALIATLHGNHLCSRRSRARLVPSKGQSILEGAIVFIRDKVAIETLGEKNGRRYAPILTVIFLGVFFMNITGVIPGLNIAASSVVAVPLVFAVLSYIVFIAAGIKQLGAGTFFKNQLFPPGVP